MKGERSKYPIFVGDINAHSTFAQNNYTNQQGYRELNNTINQQDLINIQRILHENTANKHSLQVLTDYTPKPLLGHKANLNKLQKIEIIQSMLIIVESNQKSIIERSQENPNTQKANNTFIHGA